MGFSNGLMAFYEEPDEVKALMEYMCDWYLKIQAAYIDYLNPDIITDMDDTAAWAQPFVSPAMFREFLLPYHSRQVKVGRDRGLPITFHNCGRAEDFMEDLVGIGVCAWDPAQTSNDLDAVKKKFGNKLCLMGCWDSRGRLLEKDVTDDEIRESVHQAFDRYAPGGGYAFCGGFLGPMDDAEVMRKNIALHTEVAAYGKTWYKTH
jgi:uroporphyrinogen-III decarboxylase